MSKQTNSAYPLRVIYKKGDLVEYNPETHEPVRSPSYADSTCTQVRKRELLAEFEAIQCWQVRNLRDGICRRSFRSARA